MYQQDNCFWTQRKLDYEAANPELGNQRKLDFILRLKLDELMCGKPNLIGTKFSSRLFPSMKGI